MNNTNINKSIEDKYNISEYTDEELYDILDLNHPTDRELEAKIIHMINKYANMQNESGYKLAIFFQNMYAHFFDIQEEPIEQSNITEGFDTIQINNSEGTINEKSSVGNEVVNKDTNKSVTATDIINTTNFNYTKDKFGLNPLLKQTISRVLSIDSRYRDNKSSTIDTNFTLNLSEPLRDVVSLTLEGVQIPVSWYTINNSYGANFFMLKGRSDGINTTTTNGYHDLQIAIAPGNYVLDSTKSNCITTVINQTIIDLSNHHPDINFGESTIKFDTPTIRTTLTLDIQKAFNETNFYVDFSKSWSPSINNSIPATDIAGLNNYRSKTISSYLGFNNKIYKPYSISSNQSYLTNNSASAVKSIEPYTVNNTNNTFHIVNYIGTTYLKNTSIVGTYPISIENGIYSRTELYTKVNTVFQNTVFLDQAYSKIEQIQITDPSNSNFGYTHYEMSIKLNRFKVKPVPNSKVAVIFPDESQITQNTIWTIQLANGTQSCFFYDNSINETNTIYAETPCVYSTISVDNYTYIYFKCISPINYAQTTDQSGNIDFSANDIKLSIPSANYSLTSFISIINNLFYQNSNYFTKNTSLSINNNNIFTLNIDIQKQFLNDPWSIYIDKDSLLTYVFGIPNGFYNLIDLSNTNYRLNITKLNPTIVYSNTSILTYYPNRELGLGNLNDSTNNILTTKTTFASVDEIINEINYQFKIFSITDPSTNTIQYPFANTLLQITKDSFGIITDGYLTLNINYFLSENNYEIYFYDSPPSILPEITYDMSNISNSWNNMNINFNYNINNIPNISGITYKTIIGNNPILLNGITINNTNNQFNIIPYTDIPGINIPEYYFNVTVPIININYTTSTLLSSINDYFDNNPILQGSHISSYVKNNKENISLSINLNIIYTSKDYDLVFYDTVSYVKCFVGATSVKNTSWDSTLGWVLGFHDYTDYLLTQSNQTLSNISSTPYTYYKNSATGKYTYENIYSTQYPNQITNTVINLTGDTATTTSMYNYFLIIINDYIQNHLNDGLVTITSNETNLPLPSYSSNSTAICDPITNTPTAISTTNTNGLTQKQIYALNQTIISQQQSNKNIYSTGPNVQDVFAIIQAPPSTQTPGTYYTLTGGNLQNQSRAYFGPVNISRLSIQLQNDKGEIVDLNGSSWSFSLLCEQLYRS